VSTGGALPFWFASGRDGLLPVNSKAASLLLAGVERDRALHWSRLGTLTYGASVAYVQDRHSKVLASQYWLQMGYAGMSVTVGARKEPERYAGLSHTNGNVLWSGNARPLPGVALQTDGFIRLLRKWDWLTVKGLYAEYLLDKDQYVQDAHLHRKHLLLRLLPGRAWRFTAGLEHVVFWGGTSPVFGRQPGWSDYLRYITSSKGGPDALPGDQQNAAGNSLGAYQLEIARSDNGADWSLYWNHMFEDASGREMANYRDGLWGLHWHRQAGGWVTDVLYEFMNTRHQSGTGPIRGYDSYFNNGYYSSGYVFHNRTIGTPLLMPALNEEGVSVGFRNNRVMMHHLGLGGQVWGVQWKGLCTWSRNFGSRGYEFPEPREQCSLLLQGGYGWSLRAGSVLQLSLGVAGDFGDMLPDAAGGFLKMHYSF